MRIIISTLTTLFAILCGTLVYAQDSSEPEILLSNQRIQLECTEAVDSMYNFNFEAAEKQFTWLKQQYPTHPLPYFLMGLSTWWKIMPWDDQRQYDDTFIAYMDTTIRYAEKIQEKDKDNPEAYFFLAAANGFLGRIYSDKGDYTKAAFVAKRSLNALNDSEQMETILTPELLFGTGLYNYFREWIPENKKFLKPVMLFFRKGDKELGLEQLQTVSEQAFYARIEAMTFLARIYGDYEDNRTKAYPILEYLVNQYPDNSYFATEFSELCYHMGKYNESVRTATSILYKYHKNKTGYTVENARKASFFLGSIYRLKQDTIIAKKHFEYTLDFAKKANAEGKGYYWYSLEYLAKYAIAEGNTEKAIEYYREVEDKADKNNAVHDRAKDWLKENDPDRKGFWFF